MIMRRAQEDGNKDGEDDGNKDGEDDGMDKDDYGKIGGLSRPGSSISPQTSMAISQFQNYGPIKEHTDQNKYESNII